MYCCRGKKIKETVGQPAETHKVQWLWRSVRSLQKATHKSRPSIQRAICSSYSHDSGGGLLRIKLCAICKFSGAGTPSLVPALCENGKAVLKILAPAQNKKTNSNYRSRVKLVLLLQPNLISAATESDAGKPFLSLARSDGAQVLPDVLRRQESAANSSPSGDIK